MRIAYLDPHPLPDVLPETLQILQTVDALGMCGIEVEVVAPEPKDRCDPAAILGRPLSAATHLHHLPDMRRHWWVPGRSNRPFYRQALAWLRKYPVDAVLVRNLKLAEYLLNAGGGKDKSLPPLFFETHEIFAQTYREEHPQPSWRQAAKLRKLVAREKLVYQRAAGLIGLTSLLLGDITHHYGIATPTIIAADGVDDKLAAQAKIRNSHPKPVLLYLGSLHPWKGVDTLISMMQQIQRAELWIAGGNESRIAELKALAEKMQVAHSIRFLGEVHPLHRFDIINQADVCLLPLKQTSIGSRYTSPLKLFEYMALSKAIVISDLPAIREVLVDKKNALLVEAESPSAFSDAVNRLLEDQALRENLGTAAHVTSLDYTWQARAKRIIHFIETHTR